MFSPTKYLSPERIAAVERIIAKYPCDATPLDLPEYRPRSGPRAMLAVETFRRHMTDEAWQLQIGLEHAGYELFGRFLPNDENDALAIAQKLQPSTLIVQDKREWDPSKSGCFDKAVAFSNVPALADDPSIFRVTVLKDLLFDRAYTRHGHAELRPHAVIHYYHPDLVRWLAPWLAGIPLIRTWHTLDTAVVPKFNIRREKLAILSGALNRDVYPLRQRVADAIRDGKLPGVDHLRHPGYGAHGTCTPDYLKTLSNYKVAICTSSVMGFALRKIIEATAAGCIVVTDLPAGEDMPFIDCNLVRIPPAIPMNELEELVADLCSQWDEDRQVFYAMNAIDMYNYRRIGSILSNHIEHVRSNYQ